MARHAADLKNSDRLQQLHYELSSGRPTSSLQLLMITMTPALSTSISELRANGAEIRCEYGGKTRTGRRCYMYTMTKPAPAGHLATISPFHSTYKEEDHD